MQTYPSLAEAIMAYAQSLTPPLSAAQVAKRLGMSSQGWNHYLRGGRTPRESTIDRWMTQWERNHPTPIQFMFYADGFACAEDPTPGSDLEEDEEVTLLHDYRYVVFAEFEDPATAQEAHTALLGLNLGLFSIQRRLVPVAARGPNGQRYRLEPLNSMGEGEE